MQKNRQGLIVVYTGEGKGKTTAALGLALRAAGQGLKVLILQFMKGIHNIGEIKALTQSKLSIEIEQFGRPGFVQSRACEPLDIHLALEGLKSFRRALQNANHDLIILDEILVAVDFGLLKAEELCKILETKTSDVHVVLTGRGPHKNILKMADLVTEMKEIKHPYQVGVKAQIGIDF